MRSAKSLSPHNVYLTVPCGLCHTAVHSGNAAVPVLQIGVPQCSLAGQLQKNGDWSTPLNQRHTSRLRYHSKAAASSDLSLTTGHSICEADKHKWRDYQAALFKRMLGFMGPALLIPMGDPLMSLVDTVCIGQFAGTAELAALGPANMIFNFAMYTFQSLQVATLSQVAPQIRDKQQGHAARTLGTALIVALAAGVGSMLLLAVFRQQLIIGTGVRSMELVPHAANYLGIRALAQPAVLLTMVSQSAMLAQQDSVTPCLSVLLTVAASLVANMIFVAWLGWGLKGAAITTVFTQYLGLAALMWALHDKNSKLVPNWSLPPANQLLAFLKTMVPLTVVSLSKNLCYLALQTTAATLSLISLAAHQAAFSIWGIFTWTMSPIEQGCLAYLPSAKQRWEKQATGQLVGGMGLAVSSTAALVLGCLLAGMPGLFVKDVAVQPVLSSVTPQAVSSLLLVGCDVAASSINIALRDFDYVARSYAVTLAAIAGYLTACRQLDWGLSGVWWGLVVFFGVRAAQSAGRAVWLLSRLPETKQDDGQQQGHEVEQQQETADQPREQQQQEAQRLLRAGQSSLNANGHDGAGLEYQTSSGSDAESVSNGSHTAIQHQESGGHTSASIQFKHLEDSAFGRASTDALRHESPERQEVTQQEYARAQQGQQGR